MLPSNLEDHPTGTINLNAIQRGNLAILNDTFTASHTGAQRGLLEAAIIGQATMTTIAYAASVNASLLAKPISLLALTGDVTIAVTDKAPGRSRILILTADATPRNVTWPAGALWSGPSFTAVPASTSIAIQIHSTTSADAGLVLSGGGAAYLAGSGISLTGLTFAADATIARLASPALTGTPTAPTAAPATNTTQLATTAYADAAAAAATGTTYTAGTGLTLTGFSFSVDASITCTLSGSQTLTNKNLTAPVITAADIEAATFKLATAAYVEITSSRAATDADNGKVLWSSAAYTLTIPDSLTKPFGCSLKQEGAGAITVAVSGTAVLRNVDSHTKTGGQWTFAAIDYRTGNDVVLTGRTAT